MEVPVQNPSSCKSTLFFTPIPLLYSETLLGRNLTARHTLDDDNLKVVLIVDFINEIIIINSWIVFIIRCKLRALCVSVL